MLIIVIKKKKKKEKKLFFGNGNGEERNFEEKIFVIILFIFEIGLLLGWRHLSNIYIYIYFGIFLKSLSLLVERDDYGTLYFFSLSFPLRILMILYRSITLPPQEEFSDTSPLRINDRTRSSPWVFYIRDELVSHYCHHCYRREAN